MNNYVFIPAASLCCYLFLLLAFIAARRSKVNNAFIMVLIYSVLWTGGSFCMRMQFWPSEKLWYNISLFGLLMMAYGLFYFGQAFVEAKPTILSKVWLIALLAVNGINIATGLFLAPPVPVETAGGKVNFVYTSISWPIGILFAVCAAILIHMAILFKHCYKRDELKKRQLRPILVGILCLFAGQLAICLPIFSGFPIGVLSALFMVFCMCYALYKKRIFKLTLLVSRGSCHIAVAIFSIMVFVNTIEPSEHLIKTILGKYTDYYVVVTAILFTLFTYAVYTLLKYFVDNVFIKDEITKSDILREFSGSVSDSLEIEQVLRHVTTTIQKLLSVNKVFIFIENNDGTSYDVAYSSSPLDNKTVSLSANNPVVQYLEKDNDILIMEEFRCLTIYKSMWESEKKHIETLKIEAFIPLKDCGHLIGVIAVSEKENNARLTYDDIGFLSSISSIGSIAVKNSRLYERVYMEARTDELTGILNRKYFYNVLHEEFYKDKDRPLALIILNLDDFKLYNQLYGMREGDLALQNVARIISATVGDRGYAARYSGKEFAVILPGYDMLAASSMAENIRKQILDMNRGDKEYALKILTVSGGISAYPYSAGSVLELVDSADMAVYQVKRHGKNAIMMAQNVNLKGTSVKKNDKPASAYKQDVYSEYASTIYALVAAIDTKDHYTFSHSKNVAYYASELAKELSMDEDMVELLREAALLHDIGKIGIPESVLNKPGKLTPEEFDIMKTHVENSISIIRHLPSLDYVIPAVIGHHERYDGTGYPRKLKGEDIPLLARILCIADSFDAMISKRSYKASFSVEYALNEIHIQSGKQFDPMLADHFIKLVKEGTIEPKLNIENPQASKFGIDD